MSSNQSSGCTQPEVAKRFYHQFKAEQALFSRQIQGIPLLVDKLNYASLLMKRLLFLYFLQKQYMLDSDLHYLSNQLQQIQDHLGKNHFYRQYLLALFSQLYGTSPQFNIWKSQVGTIPTLPLPLFEIQEIELINEQLDVPDQAFIQIFDFFDLYTWQVDVGASQRENELRPDILAYILERSIDQKQSGAYYTQEDITTYIASRAIIASLFGNVIEVSSSEERAHIWRLLQANPDRYIHAAIRSTAYLIEETEIEYQQRRMHYQRLSTQLHSGIIQSVDDLITYNLDLEQFAVDVIRHSESYAFVLTVYTRLTKMLILDPTCGTGAFLFAALMLLHTLYTACVERVQDIPGRRRQASEDRHISPFILQHVNTILEQIELHSTPAQFIFSTIVTHNLYGVDLMDAAVEICRLRLLLTVLAHSESSHAQYYVSAFYLNIRTGNTLFGDIGQHTSSHYFSSMMRQSISTFNGRGEDIRDARREDKPFHWQEEFPMLVERGGFDVIIGNPPYLEYSKVKRSDALHHCEEKSCGNLYAAVIERSLALCHPEKSYLGLIVPISICSGERFAPLRQTLFHATSTLWLANFEIFPCRLFANAFQRVSIILAARHESRACATLQVTKTHRWFAEERSHLLQCLLYKKVESSASSLTFPKSSSLHQEHIVHKMLQKACGTKIATLLHPTKTEHFVYYQEATNYWTKAVCCIPYYRKNGEIMTPSHGRFLFFGQERTARIVMALMNSSLFYIWFITYADGFHLSHTLVKAFPISTPLLSSQKLYDLALLLEKDIQLHAHRSTHNTKDNRRTQQPGHRIELEEYHMRHSKNILDEVDRVLAQYYNFSQEELDFIINYDIKYRLSKRGKK
jgi:predicted RNA methylase